jgi:uncharacterized protein DUF4112
MPYNQRMPSPVEPEVILPGERAWFETRRHLERLVALLDDMFEIPGLKIRFGIDPIIGLVPGIGDFLTGLMSMLVILAAWQRGVPKVTIARMLTNVAIDSFGGTIPIVGDLFDVAWKSNRKNYDLLLQFEKRGETRTWRDWAFFAMILLALSVILVLPVLILLVAFKLLFLRH